MSVYTVEERFQIYTKAIRLLREHHAVFICFALYDACGIECLDTNPNQLFIKQNFPEVWTLRPIHGGFTQIMPDGDVYLSRWFPVLDVPERIKLLQQAIENIITSQNQ